MERKYNFIYEKLVSSDDDLIGLVAYSIYKRHKIDLLMELKKNMTVTLKKKNVKLSLFPQQQIAS